MTALSSYPIRIHIERRGPTVTPPPARELRILADRLAECAVRRNPKRRWAEIDIVLLNDAEMTEANRQCLDHEGSTDVITLAYRPMSKQAGWRGEILINLDLAHRLGRRHGGAGHELALYIAHGMDHLSDAHDRTPDEQRRMRRRELRWRAAAFHAGGLRGLEQWGTPKPARRTSRTRTEQC